MGTIDNLGIRYIQFRSGVTIDGNWGLQTNAAVKTLQTRLGLVADGIVGPNTWKLLIG